MGWLNTHEFNKIRDSAMQLRRDFKANKLDESKIRSLVKESEKYENIFRRILTNSEKDVTLSEKLFTGVIVALSHTNALMIQLREAFIELDRLVNMIVPNSRVAEYRKRQIVITLEHIEGLSSSITSYAGMAEGGINTILKRLKAEEKDLLMWEIPG